MKCCHCIPILLILLMALPAAAQPPQRLRSSRSTATASTASAERWVRQLDNEINHLQEDLHYQRGSYPRGLDEQAEQASRAVVHFHHVLSSGADRQHLLRDFQEMDQQVHRLVDLLNQSNDSWLRRQAARIIYPDEQLHYVLQAELAGGRNASQELLARHAHLLAREAENLRELSSRIDRRDGGLRDAVQEFADATEHFHEVAERDADLAHLHEDFRKVDDAWHQAVDRINQSSYGYYLRRTAQDVNRVHNQIYELLNAGQQPIVSAPAPPTVTPPPVPTRPERRVGRPAIEFEIPGLGRVRIPQ